MTLPGCRGCDDPDPSAPGGNSGTATREPAAADLNPPVPAELVGLLPDRAPDDTPHLVVDRLLSSKLRWSRITRGGRWVISHVRGRLMVFDASQGRLVLERLLWGSPPCRGAHSVTPDGRRVLVNRGGGEIRLVNLWTGDTVRGFEPTGEGAVACTMSQDGTRVVTARPGTVQIWDPGKPEALETLAAPTRDVARRLIADAKAQTIVLLAEGEAGIVGWAWGGDGGRRWRKLAGLGSIDEPVLGWTGKLLSDRQGEQKTRLIDTWTGKNVDVFDGIAALAFTEHDTRVVLEGKDNRLTVVELETREVLDTLDVHAARTSLAIAHDGRRVAQFVAEGDEDRFDIRIWGEPQARFERRMDQAHVRGLAFFGTRLELFAGQYRTQINTGTGQPKTTGSPWVQDEQVRDFQVGHRWAGRTVPAYRARDVAAIDDATGELVWSRRLEHTIRDFAADRSGDRFVALTRKGKLAVLAAGGEVEADWAGPPIRAMATSPIEDVVIACRGSGSLVGLKIPTGELLWSVPAISARRPRVAVSRDGSTVVRCSSGACGVFERHGDSYSALREVPVGIAFSRLALSDDGARLAVSDGIDVTTWDVATGDRGALIQALPEGRVVVSRDGLTGSTAGVRPWLRWRRGLEHIPRGTDELPAIWTARTDKELAL